MSKEKNLIPELRFPEFAKDDDWVKKSIGTSAKVSAGGTPTSTEPKYWEGNIPWMNSGELNLKKVYSVAKNITELGLKESSTKKIPPLCVLIGLAGQGKTRGTAAINYIELCTNQSIAAIHPNCTNFNSEFLYHKIDSMYKELRQLSTGQGGRGGLNLSIIREIKIPFPSIPEQQKIAFCLSSLDDVIEAHNQKLDELKDHKKGLMQNLFPQEGQKVSKNRFPEFENDGEWKEHMLGNVISYFKGFAFKSKDYTSSGRRIVRVSDMGFDYIKKEEKAIYICKEKANQYDKWQLQENDLIVTTVGSKPPVYDSLVGRTIVVKSKDEGSLLNQNAVCLRANKKIEQRFLNTLFKRSEYIHFIESIIRGNANQGSITLEGLFQYQILVPKSKEEQQKIASCISALDELVTEQLNKLEQLKEHKKGLMQGLFPNNDN